jgi:hypothetical protein
MSNLVARKLSLVLGLGGSFFVVAAVGCNKSEGACAKGAVAQISGEHGHAAEIPADHVKRGVGGSYQAKGGDHEHVISLKDADFAKLAAGEKVRTVATSVSAHTHEVEVSCK